MDRSSRIWRWLFSFSIFVVPVFAHGKVVGELDIDSHFPAAFAPDDQRFVQHCAALVGAKFEKSGH